MEIKVEKLKSSLDCDDAFISKLMSSFIEETNECMVLMKLSLGNDDYKKVRGAAHKMLGSCNIFELEEMIELLKAIEIDAENESDVEDLPKKFSSLQKLHKETIKLFRQFITENSE